MSYFKKPLTWGCKKPTCARACCCKCHVQVGPWRDERLQQLSNNLLRTSNHVTQYVNRQRELSLHHVAAQPGLRRERAKALYSGAASLKHSHKIHSHKSGQGAEQEGWEGGWLGGTKLMVIVDSRAWCRGIKSCLLPYEKVSTYTVFLNSDLRHPWAFRQEIFTVEMHSASFLASHLGNGTSMGH